MRAGRLRRWWRRRGGTWWWSTLVIVLPVVTLTAIALLVLWRVTDLSDPRNRLETIRLALTVGAGTGAVVALVLAGRRQWATEHDARERRLTELYLKAVEQLGSAQPAVRHGGLYALERVAQDNPAQRQTVVDVICAYLRSPYTPPPDKPGVGRLGVRIRRPLLHSPAARTARPAADHPRHAATATPQFTASDQDRRQEREVRLTAQRILSRHLNPGDSPKHPVETFWANIDLNLDGALLLGLDLTTCKVRSATFIGSLFTGDALFDNARFTDPARFDKAQFTGDASFREAQFTDPASFRFTDPASFHDAQFTGRALFHEAQFTGIVEFDKAQFTGDALFDNARFTDPAAFREAQFTGHASFDDAQFTGHASFRETQFTGHASFRETQFTGHASFRETQFTGDASFREAQFSRFTTFAQVQFELRTPKEVAQFLPLSTQDKHVD